MRSRLALFTLALLIVGVAAGEPPPAPPAKKTKTETHTDVKSGTKVEHTETKVDTKVEPSPKVPIKEVDSSDATSEKKADAPSAEFDQEKFDQETLKAGNLPREGPALLKFFQTRTVTDADRARIESLIREFGAEDFDAREAACAEAERYGMSAVGLLRQAERDGDVEVALRCERILARIEKVATGTLSAAAARTIARLKPEGAAEVLLAYLPLADDESVSEAVRSALAAVAVRNGRPDPVMLKTLGDTDPLRRGAAAEAFARGGDRELRAQMRGFLRKEKDLDARLYVALALVTAAKDREVVPDLIRLLAELPQEKGWRVEEVLCQLAGEETPNVSLGHDPETRKKARDAWLAWWDKNGAKVDLARLDAGERLLGYTLIMEMDPRGAGGRVVEIGPDNKERWKITNLQFPSDAVVLPGNKVLVAEQNTNRVSERDLSGKELWAQNLNQPVNVQRLPNGNTVAVGRNQIFEWDSTRKQVFHFNRPQYDIVAGRKTRSGDYVFITQSGQCVRVDKDSKQVKTFSIGRVNYWAGIDVLPNNRVLVTQWNAITEYDLETGKAGWSVPFQQATSVQRLPNGNTLVTSMNRMQVVELDRSGKSVWEFKPTDLTNRPWRAKRR